MSDHRTVLRCIVMTCILMLLTTQLADPIYGCPQGTDTAPTQFQNPILVNVQTNASGMVSNRSGGSIDFPGYISCSAPLWTVSAQLSVVPIPEATANPSNIDVLGRNNVSFKFSILIPQFTLNGTTVTAQATINVQGTAPGRSYNDTITLTLVGTVLNEDNIIVANPKPSAQNQGTSHNTNTTKPKESDLSISAYVPIITVLAVVGIIAGAVIKIMARRGRKAKAIAQHKGPS
jgi:hypothetical protein